MVKLIGREKCDIVMGCMLHAVTRLLVVEREK
jgi:hypothetical protein